MRWLQRVAAATLGMLALAPIAQASSWDFIVKSDDGLVTFYGDPKSLVVRGSMRKVRLLYDYKKLQQDPDTFVENRSTTAVTSLDCQNRKLASMQSTMYAGNMAKGKVTVTSALLPESDLHYVEVASGSIDEKVLNYACKIGKKPGSQTQKDKAKAKGPQ
jgi:hypothetical protein